MVQWCDHHHTLGGDMESPAELRRRAKSLLDLAATVEQAGELAYRLDQMADGSVLVFTKRFQRGGPNYSYAAIKANGRWSTTGPKSPKDYTSAELSNWLRGRTVGSGRPVDDLRVVSRVEPVHEAYVTVHDGEGDSSGGEADELARMAFDHGHPRGRRVRRESFMGEFSDGRF